MPFLQTLFLLHSILHTFNPQLMVITLKTLYPTIPYNRFIFIQQKIPISEGGEMNVDVVPFQCVSKHLPNEDKASGAITPRRN